MASTYFDYVLSQCRTSGIGSVCDVVSTRRALIEMAYSEFSGCHNITSDSRLCETVKVCLDNHGIIDPNTLGRDVLEVYSRCRTMAFSEERIDYERWFDLLVDFNWIQASIQNTRNGSSGYVELLSDPVRIRRSLKKYLFGVYEGAVQDSKECVYIDEAIQAKRKFFSGLFPFKYEESRYYASMDLLPSDLRTLQQDRRENSHKGMALFFGLTATAALADNIRRGCEGEHR